MWLMPRARETVRWNDRCSCIATGWDRRGIELADTRTREQVCEPRGERRFGGSPAHPKPKFWRQKAWRSAGPTHQNPSLAPMGL